MKKPVEGRRVHALDVVSGGIAIVQDSLTAVSLALPSLRSRSSAGSCPAVYQIAKRVVNAEIDNAQLPRFAIRGNLERWLPGRCAATGAQPIRSRHTYAAIPQKRWQ
jgi:hypothetical protein